MSFVNAPLGKFQVKKNIKSIESNNFVERVKFIGANDFKTSFVKRRGNFHGIELNGMVELEPPMVYYPNDFTNKAKFFSNNDTYDMTNVVSGYFIDILHSLEKHYNFTTKLFKRKDGQWGMPKTLVEFRMPI